MIVTAVWPRPEMRWTIDWSGNEVPLEAGDSLVQRIIGQEWHFAVHKADGTVVDVPSLTVYSS